MAVALLWCVLGFDKSWGAAPQSGRPPFANSVEQRGEMIRALQDITVLLKEQTRLLRAHLGQAAKNDSKQP